MPLSGFVETIGEILDADRSIRNDQDEAVIAEQARDLLRRVYEAEPDILQMKKPSALIAGAIYIAGKHVDPPITQHEVWSATRIPPHTIRRLCKMIERVVIT